MKTQFLKEKFRNKASSLESCKRICKKHCKKGHIGIYDKDKDSNEGSFCYCYEQTDKSDANTTIFKLENDKKFKVNKIAFWVTFSFFMIFVLILIYFLVGIFFQKT